MLGDDAPILEFDPSPTAVIEPAHVVPRLDHAPEHAVLCLFGEVIERLERDGTEVLWELRAAHGIHPVYGVEVDGRLVAVFHPGVGAPLAGAFFEEAIEAGCRKFVGIGMAGGLVPAITIGHVTVPTSAVRDEGTSYHYMPPSREVQPSAGVVSTLEAVLARHEFPSSRARPGRRMRPIARRARRSSVAWQRVASAWRWRRRRCSRSPGSVTCRSA